MRFDDMVALMELAERLSGDLDYSETVTEEALRATRLPLGAHVFGDGTARSYVRQKHGRLTVYLWGPTRLATLAEREQVQLRLVGAQSAERAQ